MAKVPFHDYNLSQHTIIPFVPLGMVILQTYVSSKIKLDDKSIQSKARETLYFYQFHDIQYSYPSTFFLSKVNKTTADLNG